MTISKEFLDELLKGCERPEGLLGDAGLMRELKVKLMERMLGAELTAHLGYDEGKDAPPSQANRRNGTSSKVLKGQDGALPISVPRDREGSFEPELIKKGQTRIDGMDDKIIGLYAAGLTVRDIRAHLEDVYGLQVSPDLISRVTDAVLDDASPRNMNLNTIGFAQIGDFKGLESEVVVLVDMPRPGQREALRSLHYVGMSRARALLSMICC